MLSLLTQAGQTPSFSGSTRPQRSQRLRSTSVARFGASPAASWFRLSATSANLAARLLE